VQRIGEAQLSPWMGCLPAGRGGAGLSVASTWARGVGSGMGAVADVVDGGGAGRARRPLEEPGGRSGQTKGAAAGGGAWRPVR
jgi:hypothetical protein